MAGTSLNPSFAADESGLPALADLAAALDLGATGDQEVVHPV
jgi:hypothetical protein